MYQDNACELYDFSCHSLCIYDDSMSLCMSNRSNKEIVDCLCHQIVSKAKKK